jgi:hypothetical protein
VFLGEAPEVQISKDVAEQDQTAKAVFLEHAQGIAGTTGFRTQVQVGKD